jgi:hypothetical protein
MILSRRPVQTIRQPWSRHCFATPTVSIAAYKPSQNQRRIVRKSNRMATTMQMQIDTTKKLVGRLGGVRSTRATTAIENKSVSSHQSASIICSLTSLFSTCLALQSLQRQVIRYGAIIISEYPALVLISAVNAPWVAPATVTPT